MRSPPTSTPSSSSRATTASRCRLALVVEGLRPGVRLIVTIYNRDLAAQVRRAVRNVRVMSMAEIVAPALAGPCLGEELVAITRSPEPGRPPRGVRTSSGRGRNEITPAAEQR